MSNEKKIAILLGDGMADYPIPSLGNRTPLQAAKTPHMDYLAKNGILGLVRTVPEGMSPGSDTANLSVFGYDPRRYYSGRAPLEAISMGIDMAERDVAFRCNIVHIDDSDVMVDFSADHIDTAYTRIIIDELNGVLGEEFIKLFPGVSYRNILLWRDYPYNEVTDSTPPHDIQGRVIGSYLPRGDGSDLLRSIMRLSREVVTGSERIQEAGQRYRGMPTAIWLWGGGRRPAMTTLAERFGLRGYTISAVDLIHGIGKAAGLTPLPVEGVTGYIDTNYRGKAEKLLSALHDGNFVFLHVESPDESGHEGNIEHKIQAIEDFDEQVVGTVLKGIDVFDDYSLLVMPDHPTPISLKTHTPDPVPFCIYNSTRSDQSGGEVAGFDETSAAGTGIVVEEGHRLIEMVIAGKIY